jgi:hypothetical protein
MGSIVLSLRNPNATAISIATTRVMELMEPMKPYLDSDITIGVSFEKVLTYWRTIKLYAAALQRLLDMERALMDQQVLPPQDTWEMDDWEGMGVTWEEWLSYPVAACPTEAPDTHLRIECGSFSPH